MSTVGSLAGGYNVFSGSVHARIWWLLQGYQGSPVAAHGVSPAEHENHVGPLTSIASAAVVALIMPMARASNLFGRAVLRSHLALLTTKCNRILGS